MKKGKKLALFAGIVVVFTAVVVLIVALSSGHRVIKVDDFEGVVTFERNSEEKDIVEGMNLKSKDSITTGTDGLMELLVDTDKHILAREETCFEIISQGNEKKGTLKIKLKYGTSLIEIENKLNDKSFVEVETPNASLNVRGTIFEVSYSKDEEKTLIEVTDGVVEITSGDETKEITEGQIATVTEDSIMVVDKYLQYNEVPAFQVGHTEMGRISNIFVKELAEWGYELSDVEGVPVDELVKEGIRIRYCYETESEIQDKLRYLESLDLLQSTEVFINDDGAEILATISKEADMSGVFQSFYGYYKRLGDGWVVSIMVSDLDEPDAVTQMDIEDFVPLTNDCYYFYGLPEGMVAPGELDGSDAEEVVIEEENAYVLDDMEPGTTVYSKDLPILLRGETTAEEMNFILRVCETTRLRMNQKFIENGLEIIWYEPELVNVYAPINGTEFSYDVDVLNDLFTVMTIDQISESNIPEYATLDNGVLTFEPCPNRWDGSVTISVAKMYFGEDKVLCIDYIFRQTDDYTNVTGTTGTTRAYFTPDDNGAYKLDHLMECDSHRFDLSKQKY